MNSTEQEDVDVTPEGPARQKAPAQARRRGGISRRHAQPQLASETGPNGRDFPVVGVGASAGGLEAFTKLFQGLPAKPGLAFVLIQHLDPSHESMLVELLARHTGMKVAQAADGMPIESDRIYIIPPKAYLSIRDGNCHLLPFQLQPGARLPFDHFLASMAEEFGPRAIAVVLSGTGSDGSVGIKAVNEKGGLVIVQDPAEAAYDGMPRSAIRTGIADLVLPLAKMPETLLQIRRHAYARTVAAAPAPAAQIEQPFGEILNLVRQQTSHDFAPYKEATLLRRIHRRMALIGIDGLDHYVKALRDNGREVRSLDKDLLIHVTRFFRDPEHFQFLQDKVIPALVQRQAPDQPIRVWVPGCSTGEEAYSIGMLLLEHLAAAGRNAKLQIFATDLDSEAVAFARQALYPESIRAEMSPARLERFFTKEDGSFRVVPQLREAILFTVHDVLADAPFSRIDLISCRNVLIYLQQDPQEKVLALFHFALREDGALFLGASESIGNLTDRFEPVSDSYRIYRRLGRPGMRDARPPFRAADHRPGAWPTAAPQARARSAGLHDLGQRQLLETYAPASVLINRKGESLHYFGPVDRYLRLTTGEASRDLLAMARDGLGPKLRRAIRNASHEQARNTVTGAPLKRNGETATVSISVQPVQYEGEPLLLVSFTDEPKPQPQQGASPQTAADGSRIAELERELDDTRKELESTIRDLEASNAELTEANQNTMSINEEFQSTNEELETSREELQSLNEELTSLNSQLQETVEQQRRTASDLQNILNSSDNATLILDRDLRIRLSTPAAKLLFGIITSDVGRPLADLSLRFADTQLLDDARAALAGRAPVRREIMTDAGAWYMRRILPYPSQDEEIEGLVVTFTDVTEMKSVEMEISAARSYAENIIDTIQEPLVVLDQEMRVISVNSAFYRMVDAKPEDTVGRSLADTDAHHLDVPELRDFVERIRSGSGNIENCQVEVQLPSLGQRTLLLNARAILQGAPGRRKILVTLDDITERRGIEREVEAAKGMAERGNLAKSRFLAAASHDLRQPLQTLRLLSGVLARKLTDVDALQLLSRFGETMDAMSVLLDAILDINQLEAGTIRPEIDRFPINDILDRMRAEFTVHARAAGLHWRVIPCSLLVRSDPRLLEQMIRNLVSNAIKYTPEGRILLGCRRHGDRLRIEVWDTGLGIPQAQFEAIFEEFHQLDSPGAERGKGLGLGLAIVERFADLLGHVVDVHSRVGKGSVFAIEVPTAQAVNGERRQPDVLAKITSSTGRRGTVLIVEDDPSVRETLELLFAAEGYRTAVASSGTEALRLLADRTIRPDVMLADYDLSGGMNGLVVIDAVRADIGRDFPAVMLTGDISTATLREIAKHRYPHLKKPVTADVLLGLVQRLLDHSRTPAGSATPARSTPAVGVSQPTIFVVDDDPGVRDALQLFLQAEGRSVAAFDGGQAFLDAYHGNGGGCLVLDAHMPGIDGFELMSRLRARGSKLPVIMITGQGDVKTAVKAIKAGAVDFIEKPAESGDLLASIDRALQRARDTAGQSARPEAAGDRLAGLTPRQRDVAELIVQGAGNKEIAARLGINQRTVETHRALVMKKTGAKSVADLVRLALAVD